MSPEQQEPAACVFFRCPLSLLLPISHCSLIWVPFDSDSFENQIKEIRLYPQDKCARVHKFAYDTNFMDLCLWSPDLTLSFCYPFAGWISIPIPTNDWVSLQSQSKFLKREDLIGLLTHYPMWSFCGAHLDWAPLGQVCRPSPSTSDEHGEVTWHWARRPKLRGHAASGRGDEQPPSEKGCGCGRHPSALDASVWDKHNRREGGAGVANHHTSHRWNYVWCIYTIYIHKYMCIYIHVCVFIWLTAGGTTKKDGKSVVRQTTGVLNWNCIL